MKSQAKSNIFHPKLLSLMMIYLLLTAILIGINTYQSFNLKLKAQGINTCRCNDPNKCFPDGCSRDNKKDPEVCIDNSLGPNMPAENNSLCYTPPDCCDVMVAENDAKRCCWVERGFCRKEQCAKLSGPKAQCGWYWDDHTGEGYGCSRVNTIPIEVPTNPPPVVPTSPVVLPTDVIIIPTSPPFVFPTNTPIPNIALPYTPIPTYITLPTSYIPPTTYIPPTPRLTDSRPTRPPAVIQITPTSIPSPASKPILETIVEETNNFWQKLKVNLTKFITTILP